MQLYFPARRGRATVRARLAYAILLGACGLITSAPEVLAHEEHDEDGFEQHHAHEHGKVTLNIALDGEMLAVELAAPAANVIGFEHQPRTDAERNSALSAANWLRKGDGLLGTPAEAGCRFVRTEFQDPTWKHETDDDAHGPEHHEEYEARFLYRCARPEKLNWLEPALLARLPNLREAQINLVGPSGQRSETVRDAHSRIPLR